MSVVPKEPAACLNFVFDDVESQPQPSRQCHIWKMSAHMPPSKIAFMSLADKLRNALHVLPCTIITRVNLNYESTATDMPKPEKITKALVHR